MRRGDARKKTDWQTAITTKGRTAGLAWMHRRQQLGGFVQMVMRDVETNLASGTPIVIENLDAAFVFHCVNDCTQECWN